MPTVTLAWGHDHQVRIDSIDDLERVVDELVVGGTSDLPFSIELSHDERSSLLLTIGGAISHLEFYSTLQSPLIVGCRGYDTSDDIYRFYHRDEYSEISIQYCVPIDDARLALRQYFQTANRPTNITWGE